MKVDTILAMYLEYNSYIIENSKIFDFCHFLCNKLKNLFSIEYLKYDKEVVDCVTDIVVCHEIFLPKKVPSSYYNTLPIIFKLIAFSIIFQLSVIFLSSRHCISCSVADFYYM